jgi:drug/metabolite transporter (DMT)-like permease
MDMDTAKGISGITLVIGALIYGAYNWLQILVLRRIPPPTWVMWTSAIAVYLLNNYVLSRRGIAFRKDFDDLPRQKRILRLAIAAGFVALAIAWLLISTFAYWRVFDIR